MYLGLRREEKAYIQAEEIAAALGIPRHFMGKVLKGLAKESVLKSNKGPSGGFSLNEHSLSTPLIKVVNITRGLPDLNRCALRLKECDPSNPCPLHDKASAIRNEISGMLSNITVADLLVGDKNDILSKISPSPEKSNEQVNQTQKSFIPTK
jgi:Rrf2 family transcriptional regulator, iron-sulfur cluster assembly transcription factor